ncbi:flavin reductase family protein [Nocardioides sp. Iso805N]|uniref:flavin reductase family protein n=1 Tax=Nocardioides sp. Iso805N TaxID=1283287 RepID=UPI00035D8FE5|nr:flavin reductase family protein [Nocardioides sp. Iso805N]
MSFDPTHFRQVLGQYPTGVVVVTALDAEGAALGMTVGSFTSVSLDPPLVAFLPDQGSRSWRALRESGHRFCINVLDASQEDVCRAVAVRKQDKFADIAWRPAPSGLPVIEGAVAWMDCVTEQVHEAGDHHIVVGRVNDLQLGEGTQPLLFFRGGYGSFTPLSLAAGGSDLLDHLRRIDLVRDQIESLAARFDTEVTAIVRVRDELVLAAAVGRTELAVAPTRVGQRLPFLPPLGSCFAAWGDAALQRAWTDAVAGQVGEEFAESVRCTPELVRRRGFAIAVGHQLGEHLEAITIRVNEGDPQLPGSALREAMWHAADGYNPDEITGPAELRLLTAPVFDAAGGVAFTLTLWGAPGLLEPEEIAERVEALRATTSQASASLARSTAGCPQSAAG